MSPRVLRGLGFATILAGFWAFAVPGAAEDWPQFRGPRRDNISQEKGLIHSFPADGPKVLWSVDVCQGYAGPAVHSGRVYIDDYDENSGEALVRCISLKDGKEIWRFSEAKKIRPNHGITRTVPAVDGKFVFSLDPKCVLHCLDAETGKLVWAKALVEEYKTAIPPWYAGQCPLIEDDRVVVAPGGEALVVALEKATGKELWRTPNADSWPMSHASLMPGELGGVRQYVYCALQGLIGVGAKDGSVLWKFPSKYNVAVAPSPLPISPDRVFMTAGYEAGSQVLKLTNDGGRFAAGKALEIPAAEWNSEVHTPVLFENHLFAVGKKKRGLFTCLSLDGKIVWTSGENAHFGLGSFLLADGVFFVLEGDTGVLRLIEANPREYHELGSAPVLSGDNVWGPMALSDGKLVLRDMRKLICIDVRAADKTP
ncbi:MAG: PQQ-like beta-propeller repeat protein [Planctomycetes bacterium]|nr:PQQ-like beta-propeller repeat protein [Planctomycetota bacterium]